MTENKRDEIRRRLAPLRARLNELRAQTPVAAATEPALPSPPRVAVNFAKAQLRHACNGRMLASDRLYQDRLAVCRYGRGIPADQVVDGHCPMYRPSDGRCAARKCGCHVADQPARGRGRAKQGKARWASERCPKGWWPGEQQAMAAADVGPAETPSANPVLDYWRGGSNAKLPEDA